MKYQIEFYSYWHCGSGLAAGADVDALVVKDDNNLPFVPGKTIKGLVREAYKEMYGEEKLGELFGIEGKRTGTLFFSNAELNEIESKAITANKLSKYLYSSVASTQIDENGLAVEHSLRKMQVVIPCKLVGEIKGLTQNDMQSVTDALKFIKRLGQNRNRGLGRCNITIL